MKRYFVIPVFIVTLLLSGCNDIAILSDQVNSVPTNYEETFLVTNESIKETISNTQPVTDFFDKYAAENELSVQDKKIIRMIYSKLLSNLTLNNIITQQYTRKPVDLTQICMVYFGEYPIVVGFYPIENNMITNSWKINEDETLSEIDFDYNAYELANKDKHGFIDMTTITSAPPFGKRMSEEDNVKWLCYVYAEYKKNRQEKYGDLHEQNDSAIDGLNDTQKELLNNILTHRDVWENYYDSLKGKTDPCIFLNIWSFGDGTSEILCTNGTVSYHNNETTQYSGTKHGYFVSKDECEELDDNSLDRLERDLSTQNELYWSNDWIDETKAEELANYILEIS